MRYEKLLKRLEKECAAYCQGEPVLIDDIYKALEEYSKQGVFNFVNKAIDKGDLKQAGRGVYNKADRIVSPLDIINKKYIKNDNEIFGIFGKLSMEPNFLISYQVPNSIDVITNNASCKRRVITIGYQKVILYKSRCKITKENYTAYTLLELFNSFNIKQFNNEVINEVKRYIKDNKVTKSKIQKMIPYFPGKAIKNMYLCGITNVFA